MNNHTEGRYLDLNLVERAPCLKTRARVETRDLETPQKTPSLTFQPTTYSCTNEAWLYFRL